MPLLDPTSLYLALAILAFAGLVHGTLGLGFPLVSTPLLALFTDVQSAILITLFPTVMVNLASIARGGHWGESIGRYWPLAVFAGLGGILGTQVLLVSAPEPFKLLLAALIVLYLNTHRLQGLSFAWIGRHPLPAMALFGLVAGFMAGTVNVMVPILVIFALELALPRNASIQLFNLCFLAGKTAQIGSFAVAGVLQPESVGAVLPLVAAAAAGLGLGMLLRERVSTETYRRLLRYLLVVTAVLLTGQFLLAQV